jgi:uncharacterized membrane protein
MKTEIIEKIAALATAAFGLVAALAWNSAIQEIFKKYYGAGEGISALLIYAVVVTIIAVMITIWIGRIADRAKKISLPEKLTKKQLLLQEKLAQKVKQLIQQEEQLAKRFKRKQ